MHILQPLIIQNGAYDFKLPISYMPVRPDWSMWDYVVDYNFKFAINSQQIITEVFHPKDCIIKKQDVYDVVIEKSGCDMNNVVYGRGSS